MEITGETGIGVEDASWKEAFKNRDYKNLAKAYLYRGSFTLPQNFSSSGVTLFYKNIGLEQSIFINGKRIAANLKQDQTSKGFIIDPAILQPGKNTISILATPVPKKYDWENVNTDPGVIQLFTPAETWHRKLFNGLAQVLVQTTKEAGEIKLTATSPTLATGSIQLRSAVGKMRPAVN